MKVEIFSVMTGLDRIDMRQTVFVVIDVLRASTTTICLLDRGAEQVVVVGDPNEAYPYKNQNYVLIGERGDDPLPGFDFDNSPYEISQHDWRGKKVAFTTTNGTRALLAVKDGFKVVIGGIRNIDSVVQYVKSFNLPIALVPIGNLGEPRIEDELCAITLYKRIANEEVDWKYIKSVILKERESTIRKKGEKYLRDVLLSVTPNDSDIVPVLCDGLVLQDSKKVS